MDKTKLDMSTPYGIPGKPSNPPLMEGGFWGREGRPLFSKGNKHYSCIG